MKTTFNFKKAIAFAFIGIMANCLIGTTVLAQAPQKFNYQGIARDAKGNPIGKQNLAIKISVLPTADASEAEYEETQTVTTNDFGLYTLQIGNGTAITGEMKSVKWETGNKYIRVAVDPKGGTDYVSMGTTQLLSVPYAIYADHAGSSASGNDKATRALAANNYIEKTIGSTPNQQSLLYDNGAGVQIGGTSPGAQFHVKNTPGGLSEFRIQNDGGTSRMGFFGDGTTAFGNLAYSTTANYAVLNKQRSVFPGNFAAGIPNSKLFVFGNAQGSLMMNTADNIGFGTFNQTSNSTTTRMFVRGTDGNVGIGHNHVLPLKQLHVIGSTGARIERADGTNQSNALDINMGSSQYPGYTFPAGTVNLISQSTSPITMATPTTSFADMTFSANTSTPQIVLKQNGNVGIGTGATAPGAKLDVNGQIRLQTGAAAGFVLQSDAAGLGTWVDPCTLPCVTAASANDWHLNGNSGTTPGVGTGQNYIGTSDNQDVVFGRNSIEAGRIGATNTSLGVSTNSTAGTNNTAIGSLALNLNTDDGNTAVGYRALKSSINGTQNTAVGLYSMELADGGNYSSALGMYSLRKNQGAWNTGLGWKTLQENTTGTQNDAVGVQALGSNTSGSQNVAMGHNALFENTTGSLNTALGFRAGEGAGTNSTQATAIGANSLVGNNSTNATALGSKAYAPNDNTVILGSINGVNGATTDTKIGIGTTAPTSTLHVEGSYSHAWRATPSSFPTIVLLGDHDHVYNIVNGASENIELPSPSTCGYREYIIVNQNPVDRNVTITGTSTGYWDFDASNKTTIPAQSSITIIANPGGSWNRIR